MAMASDAPLISLNAPLKNHCLAFWTFLVPFIDLSYLCYNDKIYPIEKSGLALKIVT